MFDTLTNKKRRKSIFVYIVLGMICAVFVFMSDASMSGSGGGQTGYAASVNDSIISINELNTTTEQVIRVNSMFFGKDYGSTTEQRQQAAAQALQSLISQELIAQEAKKSGLIVTNEELANTIVSLPYFQQDGVFSKEAYDYTLQSQRIPPSQFEGQIRRDLVNSRVSDLFRASFVKSSLQEAKEQSLQSTLLQLRYVTLNKEMLSTAVKVDASEVEKALADKDLEPSLREHFALHQKSFQQEETVKVRHILVQPKGGDRAQAKAEIEKIRTEVNPSNFADLAKKYSEDPASKSQGGDLGYISRGLMVRDFEVAAFQLDKGVVSQPVATEFGYHLLLVEDKTEAKAFKFEEVKEEVAKRWLQQKQVDDTLKQIESHLKEGRVSEIESLLASLQLKWVDSPKFDLSGESLGALADVNGLIEESLRLTKDKPYGQRLLQSGNNYYVVKLLNKESGAKPEVVKADLGQSMSSDSVLRLWLRDLQSKAKIDANMSLIQ